MALSNGNQFSGDLIFLNPRATDVDGNEVEPYFEVAKVNPTSKKIEKTGEKFTKVSGDLLRPKFTEREWKGKKSKHVVLLIRDAESEETYNLDLTYRISSRALFNAIISLTDPKGISISTYRTKKGFEALSLWQGDTMTPWKYDGRKGEIPEADVIKDKKGEVVKTDFSEVDGFFENELKAWADALFGAEKAEGGKTAANKPANSTAAKTPAKAIEPDSNDVPF